MRLMEVNRYLITALYVMAGCVVTIPLKAQEYSEPLKGERCRLIVSNTVKAISICIDRKVQEDIPCYLPAICFFSAKTAITSASFLSFVKPVRFESKIRCYISQKIRAPEIE